MSALERDWGRLARRPLCRLAAGLAAALLCRGAVLGAAETPAPAAAPVVTPVAAESPAASPAPEPYRLQVGDVVEISVFGHPDTTFSDVPVAPDGKLYYLFRNGVPAAGKTPAEVSRELAAGMTELFPDPRVTVVPIQFARNLFMIHGKVRAPGVYALDIPTTLRQGIARAGGIAQGVYRATTVEIASLRESYVLRGGRKLEVDLERLLNENEASKDVLLEPGDIVFIASGLGKNAEIFVLGAVRQPRAMAYTDGLTLVGALAGGAADMGGTTGLADLDEIVVVRGSLADPQPTVVSLKKILAGKAQDLYLVPGDLIYVPTKPFQFSRELAKEAVRVFVRSFASGAGTQLVEDVLFPTKTTP
jgi:polysaccharide export outer membrane protein